MQNIQYISAKLLIQNHFQEEAAVVTYSYNMILNVTFGWLHYLPFPFPSSNLLFPFWIINLLGMQIV